MKKRIDLRLTSLSIYLGFSLYALAQDDPFTVMIIPDTQYYTVRDGTEDFPETYLAQTTWIADHAEEENIVFAIHLGDMTNTNSIAEWEKASAAHAVLDEAGVAYSVVPGNHDYPGGASMTSSDPAVYNSYFGPDRFAGTAFYGGSYQNDNDNNYCFFNGGGHDFMVISLEHAPRKDVLCWANELITAHPNHNVILASHCYKSNSGHQLNCATDYDVIGSDGGDMWRELARRHSNVLMVLSGHISGVHYETRMGNTGNVVHELLTDYQGESYDGVAYGNGWLRSLTFDPLAETISVSSHSVLPDVSTFNYSAYSNDPDAEQHVFTINNVALSPTYAFAQTSDAFNDRTVNLNANNDHRQPQVASAASGDFMVVWEDESEIEGLKQIYVRGFSADGCEIVPETVVNNSAAGLRRSPHIAMSDDGTFVVVWSEDSNFDGKYDVLVRGYDAMGTPLYDEQIVHDDLTGQHRVPRIGLTQSGNQIIVWQDDSDEDGYYSIRLAGFDASGLVKNISDRTVAISEMGDLLLPDIAVNPDGRFVVVWQDDADGNGLYQIRATYYEVGAEVSILDDVTINQVGSGQQLAPKVAMDDTGRFKIVWQDDSDGNGAYQIYAAGYDGEGVREIDDFEANQFFQYDQLRPDIASNDDGEYIVVWEDDLDGNDLYQIRAAIFDENHVRLADDQVVNENGSGQQLSPVVSVADGHWLSVWEDDIDEDDEFQIVVRGYDYIGANPVDISDITTPQERHLRVHPNPVLDRLTLSGIEHSNATHEIRVYDKLGQELKAVSKTATWNNNEIVIDVSGLSRGVYFLSVRTGAEVRSARFVKVGG